MATPQLSPVVMHLSASPGDIRETAVTIAKAPSDALVTALIRDGRSFVRLKSVIAFEMVRRPFTDEEIAELPAFPPSIRQNARKNGLLEEQEVGRSDGATPLLVHLGARVLFELEFSSVSDQPLDILTASLTVQGSTWDPADVPLFFIIADKKSRPTPEPGQIRRAAKPGTVLSDKVLLSNILTPAKLAVFLDGGDSIIRLTNWIVSRPVRRDFTEEEINELPATPPEIRERARQNGYIEYQETARSDGKTALDVPARTVVRAYLELAAPVTRPPDTVTASLVFESTTWQTISIPVTLTIGKIAVTLSQNSLNIRQGESGFVSATVASVAGPATEVAFELPLDPGAWQIVPPSVKVGRGETVTTGLQINIASSAPVGRYQAGMLTYAFDRLIEGIVPYDLTIRPGDIFVSLAQRNISVNQGERVDVAVNVTVKGGPVQITFVPGAIPPGVSAATTIRGFAAGVTAAINVSYAVDQNAPPVANAAFTIGWTADDGEHKGTLFGQLNIVLVPDSRTFHQSITTPSGTPLRGDVDVILNNDGTYVFKGGMHDSGLPSYRFRVRTLIRGASGKVAFVLQKSGDVEGTETRVLNPFHTPRTDFNWTESLAQAYIASNWADLRGGTMLVNKSFEMTGVLGGLVDLAKDVVDFLVANALLNTIPGGQAVAGIVFLGSELGAFTGLHFADPGLIPGLVVSGLTGFLFTPSILIVLVLRNSVIKTRTMNQREIDLAQEVFGDTLPFDRILLTDMKGLQGQEVTVPHVDGSILVNIGGGFDDAISLKAPARGYAVNGQILVHELTHAWQIEHRAFTFELFWDSARNTLSGSGAYNYGPPGAPWASFGLEGQAAIVDEWYAGTNTNARVPVRSRVAGSGKQPDDPYFGYISNNIRLGQV